SLGQRNKFISHPTTAIRQLTFVDGVPAAFHLSAAQLALVRELQIAFADWFTQSRIHQLMDVKAHGFPGVSRDVEDSCVHPDRVLPAYLDAASAIDANSQSDTEANRVLVDV